MSWSILPVMNSLFNIVCAGLLIGGRYYIKKGDRSRHKRFMLSAVAVAAVFLVIYVAFHSKFGQFPYLGPFRAGFLVFLAIHTLAAVVEVPMVIATLYFALKSKFEIHRKLARWTFWIWLYVSVTGAMVYLMVFPWASL